MPNDPNLASDTCIFMESVTGDGGVHNANVWWLSPDIVLNSPISGADKADPGQINSVEVKFHRKGANSGCTFPGAESLTVELWVGNPSIVMTPSNPASAVRIVFIGSPLIDEGASGSLPTTWTPPMGAPASSPESPGHKCLIARVYPDNLTPSAQGFFAPDDQHVAQRNICIVPCDGPGAAKLPGPCGFTVTTTLLDTREPQLVTLRAAQDLRPTPFVRDTVLTSLRKLPGFKRLSPRPVSRFAFEMSDFPDAAINDRTRLGCLGGLFGGRRSYEAQIKLRPQQVTRFNFQADLSGGSFGDAYIFHLTQNGADGRAQGGLTIVMVS